jgi:hypothetical protein
MYNCLYKSDLLGIQPQYCSHLAELACDQNSDFIVNKRRNNTRYKLISLT